MADYTAREWSNGDIVTAVNLGSIERGVSIMAEGYTPTTWSNGDIVTAIKLNNIEQGIVNGDSGGDSSDFSIAEVTLIRANDDYCLLPIIIDNIINCNNYLFPQGTSTWQVPLYKGAIEVYIDGDITVSGSATFVDSVLTITGDCTITIEMPK